MKNDRGVAIITATVIVVMVIILAAAVAQLLSGYYRYHETIVNRAKAQHAAEAGIAYAYQLIYFNDPDTIGTIGPNAGDSIDISTPAIPWKYASTAADNPADYDAPSASRTVTVTVTRVVDNEDQFRIESKCPVAF